MRKSGRPLCGVGRIFLTLSRAISASKAFLVATILCLCCLQPTRGFAQAVSAKAVVNGKLKIEFEREEAAVGKGVSIAAAKIFNPVKESYRVSSQPAAGDDGNQPANAKEVENLQTLINSIKGGILGPKQLAADLKDKTKPTDRPKRFNEVRKVRDGLPLLAETEALSNAAALEEAKAKATQRIVAGSLPDSGRYLAEDMPETKVEKKAAANPTAVAFTVNRDPLAVKWDKRSDQQEVTIDLSEVSLTAETVGATTGAFALFDSDVSFINNKHNVNLSEDQALPLCELLISFVSENGAPPVLDVELEAFGNQIFDSLGNKGIGDVTDGLLSRLTQIGESTVGFNSSYSFTVVVPESPSKSVLFLRDFGIASVTAAEPTPTPTPTPVPSPTATRTSSASLMETLALGTHKLTVNEGGGSGRYVPGTVVKVTADEPLARKKFAGWSGDTEILANPFVPTTTATMPSIDVTITATYADE